MILGMVDAPWEYRWSSCRAQGLGRPDPLLTEPALYTDLGADAARRQQRWQACLLSDDPTEGAVSEPGEVLDGEAFRREAMAANGRTVGRKRGRPRKSPG